MPSINLTISGLTDVESIRKSLHDLLNALDNEEQHPIQDVETLKVTGWLVRQAGNAASRLGLTQLYQRSLSIAPFIQAPEAGVFGCICSPVDAREFLSDFIARCDELSAARIQSALKTDFSPREVAAMLGVGKDTVMGYIHSGELRAWNSGSIENPRYRITLQDIEAFRLTRAHQAILRRAKAN